MCARPNSFGLSKNDHFCPLPFIEFKLWRSYKCSFILNGRARLLKPKRQRCIGWSEQRLQQVYTHRRHSMPLHTRTCGVTSLWHEGTLLARVCGEMLHTSIKPVFHFHAQAPHSQYQCVFVGDWNFVVVKLNGKWRRPVRNVSLKFFWDQHFTNKLIYKLKATDWLVFELPELNRCEYLWYFWSIAFCQVVEFSSWMFNIYVKERLQIASEKRFVPNNKVITIIITDTT